MNFRALLRRFDDRARWRAGMVARANLAPGFWSVFTVARVEVWDGEAMLFAAPCCAPCDAMVFASWATPASSCRPATSRERARPRRPSWCLRSRDHKP